MTARDRTEAITASLAPVYGAREARNIALLVMEGLYGLSRADIALSPGAELPAAAGFDCVLRRLCAGEPVQYVLGRAAFCGLDFEVGPAVLIPRPETEELVGWVADDLGGMPSPAILDVGTGSGCIAVSLAVRMPGARVTAIDISDDALAVARRNAAAHGTRVDFVRQDALADPGTWAPAVARGRYEAVVSNPPYIPPSDIGVMADHVVRHEPHGALFAPGGDPLVFYRAIAGAGARLLAPGGRLYVEVYADFAPLVCEIFDRAGYAGITLRDDINARPRMVRGTYPKTARIPRFNTKQ